MKLLIFVLLAGILLHARASDPRCATGINVRGACCPRRCGQCGGTGCYQKSQSLNTRCCADGILRPSSNVASCNVSDPPCRVTTTSTSTPSSSLRGRWRTAPVRAGQLSKRHEACALMVNGLVVLVGGRGANRAVSVYNPVTKQWANRAGPGRGIELHHFQCVAAGGRVWIVSSWTGKFPFEQNTERVYVYDVAADKWTTRAGMAPGRRRGGAATVRRGDWIYVVAGNRGGHGAPHSKSLTWMDAYNWKRNVWTRPGRFADMPGGGRDHVGGAMVGGKLCVAGGRDGGAVRFFDAVLLTTYCYNFGNGKWEKKQNFPRGRAGAMTGATCDGRMMIAGGEGSGKAFDRVDVFDGATWKRAPNMVRARHGSGLAMAQCNQCGHIFIPSGSGNIGGSPELLSTEEWIPNGSPVQCAKYS